MSDAQTTETTVAAAVEQTAGAAQTVGTPTAGAAQTVGAAHAAGANQTAAQLLAAGAILPPDTEDAGERAVPLTARTYQHPGLSDRVVVRLVPAELGVAEDAAAGFLGLEPAADPAVVGLGLHQALGFPEWVLVHHPEDGHHALGVIPELERAARQAKTKPKAALDAYLELAARLAGAVPHFLPTYYEQAGRVFLSIENSAYAAQMFGKARTAEAEHGLPIDEERLDAVFLEFALAGALPVKVLAGYGKELTARLPGQEALARFTRLCIRRTAGGLPPSAQMTAELRKLAKATGANPDSVEQEFLVELLALPATLRAAVGWWKAHRAGLIALARREPTVRRTLLDAMPSGGDAEMAGLWLGVLLESGTADALHDPSVAEPLRPSDGTAGWLRRFQQMREAVGWWRNPRRLPQLYQLVERCADRLRAELSAPGAAPLAVPDDVDLLDLLLSLGLPVADPGNGETLNLERWSEGDGHRDLAALAADARFGRAFGRGADRFSDDEDGRRAISVLVSTSGGRSMLTEWVRAIARRFAAVGLPQLPNAIARLSWLPGEALALAEHEVRAAAATDLAPVLSRTLRAGLFDELSWPAWDQAVAELIARKDVDDLIIADAWPYLIVAGPTQVRVLGAEGTVLTHDLRIPDKDRYSDPGFHYVDGELLVYWYSRLAGNNEMRGYWHGSADRIQTIEAQSTRGTRVGWYHNLNSTLPLPGGGRAVGGGVLHRGDTVIPQEGSVLGDGTSYWVWSSDSADGGNQHGWFEFDPSTGLRGRRSNPAFFNDTLRDAPAGSRFEAGTLRPLGDGLQGWCVVTLPDGSIRGRDIAGFEVTVPKGSQRPVRALSVPGADVNRQAALVRGYYELAVIDADGVTTAEVRTDREPGELCRGTVLLPPTSFWHCMQPRDPEGSALLRRIDDAQVALLLKVGAEHARNSQTHDRLPDLVGELLPQVTDRNLLAGITGVVRYAAEQQMTLDQVAARLDDALAGSGRDSGPKGPLDSLLLEPLHSLGATRLYWAHSKDGDAVFRQLRLIGEALHESPRVSTKISLHLDGPVLPSTGIGWWLALLDGCSALAMRAASPITEPEVGDALREVLRVFDEAELAAPAQHTAWRRVTVQLPDRLVNGPNGNRRSRSWQGLLPTAGGGLLAVIGSTGSDNNGTDFIALYHDPTGRFTTPAPYALRSTHAVGEERETGWLTAFLAELAQRGPAPWFPEAAEEFARLTGTTPTEARLLMAGLPGVESSDRNTLTAETRAVLGSKSAEINVARGQLRRIDAGVRRAVVAALLPADPAKLWTDGPDAAAAAEVWNRRVGRRVAVPEALLAEATGAVRTNWSPPQALPALLDPAVSPELSRDLTWAVNGDRVASVEKDLAGFTTDTLVGGTALLAWLAYRLPAGDPTRAALPAALDALKARLAHPGLMLSLDRYVNLPGFREAAGAPTEIGENYERYGAVIMATHDQQPMPAVRVALLDSAGNDPYLPALRADGQTTPFLFEAALALVRDPGFAALLADPGDPVAGERGKDGTWSPQDPTRSVPDLVAEVAREHGLGADAAALYLMVLALPDPTDRNVARWTGWKPARLAAARAELAATDLVVEAVRPRAGRSLFLPCAWTVLKAPFLPYEQWKAPFLGTLNGDGRPVLGVLVPVEPAGQLYRRAWQRVRDGDGPRFEELRVPRARARRR